MTKLSIATKLVVIPGCLLFAASNLMARQAVPNSAADPSYHGRFLSSWLEDYGNGPKDYKPSPAADEALRQIGTNAVSYLLRLLHSTNTHPIANTLPKPAAPPTTVMPKATDPSDRDGRMTPLERDTSASSEPLLAPASWDHWKAYLGFQALGPLGRAAIPDLVNLAHDPNDNSNPSGTGMAPNIGFWRDMELVAKMAEQSSTYLAPGQPLRNGSLTRLAILPDGEIAAWSLAAIGAESIPPLMELLADPNPRLRSRAAVALGMIGAAAEPAVPTLVKMLDDPDVNTRWEAADALGYIARRPDLAVPALVAALANRDAGTKFSAIESLGNFHEQATNAIPALLTFLPDRDYRLGESVALALSKISRDTTKKEIVPFLIREIEDSRPYVRSRAARTLGEIQDDPQLTIPALIAAMDETNQIVRIAAIHALGQWGSAAKVAVPKLASLTNGWDSPVRDEAVIALKKIESGH